LVVDFEQSVLVLAATGKHQLVQTIEHRPSCYRKWAIAMIICCLKVIPTQEVNPLHKKAFAAYW